MSGDSCVDASLTRQPARADASIAAVRGAGRPSQRNRPGSSRTSAACAP